MPEHVNRKRRGQRRPILAIMNGTDLRQWTYEKGQMQIKSYKDVYNWPARDLNKCSKEVALVDIALAQIGSVLDVAVVAHEAHHAVNVFTLREGKLKCFSSKVACHHGIDESLPDDSTKKGVEAKILSFEHLQKSRFCNNRFVRFHLALFLKLPCNLIGLKSCWRLG